MKKTHKPIAQYEAGDFFQLANDTEKEAETLFTLLLFDFGQVRGNEATQGKSPEKWTEPQKAAFLQWLRADSERQQRALAVADWLEISIGARAEAKRMQTAKRREGIANRSLTARFFGGAK